MAGVISLKKRKGFIIGTSVTTVAGVALSVLYRRNIVNFASDFIKKMHLKMAELHNRRSDSISLKDKIGILFARFLDKTIMSSQVMVNFSAMKDSVLKKASYSTILAKIAEKLTALWENLAAKAVKSDYAKSEESFAMMQSEIAKIIREIKSKGDLNRTVAIDGKHYSIKEILKAVEQHMNRARYTFKQNFSQEAFEMRNGILKDRLKDVNDRFFEAYTSADYYRKLDFTRFTVEEWLAPIKNTYQGHILKSKMAISNNIEDKYVATQTLLKNVDRIIPLKDTKSRLILNNIIKNLECYKNLSGATEKETRQALLPLDIS